MVKLDYRILRVFVTPRSQAVVQDPLLLGLLAFWKITSKVTRSWLQRI